MAVIANFTPVRPNMAATRTVKDWAPFIGLRDTHLGIQARLYPQYTASYFTEAFGNVIYNERKGNKFQNVKDLDVMSFRWQVETNEVRRIRLAYSVTDDTLTQQMEFPIAFTERYYELNDTFMVDETKQMFIVMSSPIRKADDCYEYSVRLMDSNPGAEVLTEALVAGAETRWIGNVMPELHEYGFTKYTSNYEEMRGWITEHRCDIDASSRYLAMEDAFIKVTEEKDNGHQKDYLFKMPGMKKVLLDCFMQARNNSLMWQKSTMDANGHCTLQDHQGRDLIAGDGLIAQLNRYASKYNYAELSTAAITEAMNTMAAKCDMPTGNNWIFVCNQKLYSDVQTKLAGFIQGNKVDAQYLYSKIEGGDIKVGATYKAFEWAGNVVSFHVDPALTQEYPNYGYGILFDMTSDKTNGLSPVQMFSLKGQQFRENNLSGVATKDGEVASPVAGAKWVISGYAGIAAMNPYRAYILIQNA